MKRVCVIGAGSIGSLFAGHLAAVAQVSVLTRRQDHAAALRREGLRISGRSERHAIVQATADPAELPPFDLGIVATKADGLEGAVESLRGRFPNATIMTVLNGLGAERAVRAAGAWPIISGVTFMSGTRHSDTHVEYVLDTETWIGPYEDTPFGVVRETADLIASWGLKVEALPDLLPAQWSKLIFNATVNAVAALTGLPPRPALRRARAPDRSRLSRARPDRRGQGGRRGGGHRAARRSVGDERPRHAAGQLRTIHRCSRTSKHAGAPRST